MRVLAFLFALLLCSPMVFAKKLHGQVIEVFDGDTVTLRDQSNIQTKIRMAGIDAPETSPVPEYSQPFGQQAKENLSKLVFGKTVEVLWSKKDKYGRTVGKILVNGQDANLHQVTSGLAWHYKAYEKEQRVADRRSYAQAELNARTAHIGLWHDTNPIPPWDYRHGTGEAAGIRKALLEQSCPCSSGTSCIGPKGGNYCLSDSGKKRYQ
ncbi:MAG: thermonuclease family protein [Pseudomonadota bacterium]